MSDLKNMIVDEIAMCLKVHSSAVNPDQEFFTMGLDSLDAMKIFTQLQSGSAHQLAPTLLFEHDTVNKICKYLARLESDQSSGARESA